MKKCNICHKTLSVDRFGRHPETTDRLKGGCNTCLTSRTKKYKKSKLGLPARMYSHQKTNSKRRGMEAPNYSLKELRAWLYEQSLFDELYNAWKCSGFSQDLSPSCDRINDKLPYSLDNITLMTWRENRSKGHKMVRTTELHNPTLFHGGHRSVEKWSKDKKTILDIYISQSEASRQNPGVGQGNISKVCKNLLKSTGGFHWKYTGYTKETK